MWPRPEAMEKREILYDFNSSKILQYTNTSVDLMVDSKMNKWENK
jgi:hypothetical protein